MNIRIEVVGVNAGGGEQRRQVLAIERQELAMETLGLNLSESKTLLANVQDFVIAQQTNEYLAQQLACPECGRRYTSKDSASTPMKTVFGPVKVANPPVEPLSLSVRWPQDVSPDGSLASGANQSRDALSGDEVGVLDPVRQSGGFAADADQGFERRTGRSVPPMVSEIPPAIARNGSKTKGGLTPGFLARSRSSRFRTVTAPWSRAGKSWVASAIQGRYIKTYPPAACCRLRSR